MIPLATLKTAVQQALRQISRTKGVREAEAFASSTDQLLCRLNYTSDIPCHGVEEPKSVEATGIGIRALFDSPDGPLLGFGCEERDLSPAGIRRALEKAREQAVHDTDFTTLPGPDQETGPRAASRGRRTAVAPRTAGVADRALLRLTDQGLVEAGWKIIHEALSAFASSDFVRQALQHPALAPAAAAGPPSGTRLSSHKTPTPPPAARSRRGSSSVPPGPPPKPWLGLIISGDVSVVRQRIAIASTRMPKLQTDETASVISYVTAMVEGSQAKGTGYAATLHLTKFKGEAGEEAARNALRGMGGRRLPTGSYPVVLGPQPLADILSNVLLPSLCADAFTSAQSVFLGDIGRAVAPEFLALYDHGALRGGVASKVVTCEGLPTGRTDLIRNGVLTGLLCNDYESRRLRHDPHARDKLGVSPADLADVLAPRNGFRASSSRGLRAFDTVPSIVPTNLCLESAAPHTTESLLRQVGDGVYIGRIWYTYPMNGLRTGDFTCTVVGDSFLIRDGRLATPLQANTVRLTGNIRRLLRQIVGVTGQARPVVPWGADGIVYAPEVAVRGLALTEIAQFLESV